MAEPAVLLHIGAMKTGTTYVQNLLKANRKALRQQGWLVPGGPLVTGGVREVMGLTDAGARAGSETPKWDKVRQQVRAWDGAGSLISMEFLSYAGPERAQRVLAGFDPDRVHVVLTVRDARGALPSQWQSYSRNGGDLTWPEFAADLAAGRKRSAAVKTFRRTQDIPRMLEVWGALLPADRLTVVTVPPSGSAPDDLWRRFCNAAGVSAEGTKVDDSAFGNPALGYGSVELLRRINAAGLKQVRPSAYRKVVRYVARNHLIPLRSGESRPQLDRATADFALGLNARTLAAVREHAVLVGRPEELPTTADTSALPDAPAPVPELEVAAAAEAARLGMVRWFAEHEIEAPADLLDRVDDVDTTVARLASAMRDAAGH
ncbi:MAG: hypothetical protein ACXWXO_16780 [Nocardioides sp.]